MNENKEMKATESLKKLKERADSYAYERYASNINFQSDKVLDQNAVAEQTVESALTELSEIKKRAEEVIAKANKDGYSSAQANYILKGGK